MVNLFEAIIQKNTQKVKSILEQGANPNSIIDASGLSAMHFACQSQAFNYQCGCFSTFEQTVAWQKDRVNRQCSDGDIVMSVFHPSNAI